MSGKAPARREEILVDQKVTYTLEMERLHDIIRGQGKPGRVMETPVFDYTA